MPSDSKNHTTSIVVNNSEENNLPHGNKNEPNEHPTENETQETNSKSLPRANENGLPNTCNVTAELTESSVKPNRTMKQCDEVDTRSPSDKSNSEYWIRASHILPNGNLVVVDSYNDAVKLFDEKHKLIGHVTLPFAPWNVTNVTSKGHVVVTLPGASAGQLQFILVAGKLTVVKTVRSNAGCRGIVYFENKLIVMNDKNKSVQVYDTLGKMLVQRKANFHWPWYVAASAVTRTMYVSDHYNNAVICTTMDGEQVATYIHKDLKHPAGLAVHGDGTVYICGWESNNIHHITAQCQHIETILDNGEVFEPQSVAYNPTKNTLYVSERSRYKMKIFKLPPRKF